jgi:tetratricopeptide (TPR) repeat protein
VPRNTPPVQPGSPTRPDTGLIPLRRQVLAAGLLLAAGLAGFWGLTRLPGSRYLTAHGPAQWVLYPQTPNLAHYPGGEQTTVFRRSFRADGPPPHAALRVRGYRRVALAVNGHDVPLPAEGSGTPWDAVTEVDVGPYLRAGENDLSVRVGNDTGPPALWLDLDAGGLRVLSDASWESSLEGATWSPARPAGAPAPTRDGTAGADRPRTVEGLRARWPLLLGLAGLSAALVAAGRLVVRRAWAAFAGVIVGAWLVLFATNALSLNFPIGFDADGHIDYFRYLASHGTPPLADQGWEGHQPPLYYVLASVPLKLFGVQPDSTSGVLVLRAFGLVTALAGVLLVALCLGQVFPGRPAPQAAGVVVAAALPAHVYLAHYVSNDLLAGAWGTASVCLALAVLRERPPRAWRLAALGACLGAGVLTKLTAVPVAGVVVGVLAVTEAVRTRSARACLRTAGLPVLVCLLVCGWLFVRNYRHFGRPVVGNFDAVSGHHWWQYPGYASASQLLGFGRALEDPFYAGVSSVPAGLYSTAWGDGDWGGYTGLIRPPWDYQLMAAGYLLALVPAGLILVGGVATALTWLRRPAAEPGLMLALPLGAAAALVYQYAQYPYYGHGKAFYFLPALAPLCVFAGRGFQLLAGRSAWRRDALAVLLCTWALTALAAFVVRPSSADTLAWVGIHRLSKGDARGAAGAAERALAADAGHPTARSVLGDVLLDARRPVEAAVQFRRALAVRPDHAAAGIGLARALAATGQAAQAATQLEELARLNPDCADAHILLAALRDAGDEPATAVRAAREGLRVVPTESRLHVVLARGLLRTGETGETAEAVAHYRDALRFDPDCAAALVGLAWLRAAHEDARYRNGAEAVALARRACRQAGGRPDLDGPRVLAAAYAETGDFKAAEQLAGRLLDALGRSGNTPKADHLRRELDRYRAGKPLREKPQALASW